MPYYTQQDVFADLGYVPVDPEQHLPKMTASEGLAACRQSLNEIRERYDREHPEEEHEAA